jgi:hypothetical protein
MQVRTASQFAQYVAKIDLFIWLDRQRGKPRLRFTKVHDRHNAALREAFKPLWWKKG